VLPIAATSIPKLRGLVAVDVQPHLGLVELEFRLGVQRTGPLSRALRSTSWATWNSNS